MSHAVSSSDTEDEDHQETSKNSQKQHKRVKKYKCPADFVSFEYNFSASALLDSDDQNELWLIKAPPRFDPKILTDLKLPLSGLKTVQTTGVTPQLYSVLGSRAAPTEAQILTCTCENRDAVSTSRFTGVLSINESYGGSVGNQHPFSIPTAPAPSVPPGLRQRFQPFGSSSAPLAAGAATSASPSTLKRAKLTSEGCDEQRKKKKKKRTEKHGKGENADDLVIKQEQISCGYGEEEDGTVERRRKKKKKKKERQAEDCADEVAVDASLIAKQEPVDTSYGDVDGSAKKKKKKKKKYLDE